MEDLSAVVTSTSNQWVKLCKEVASSNRARAEHGLVFIEGVHLCETYCETYLTRLNPSQRQQTLNQSGVMLIGENHQLNKEVTALRKAWSGKTLILADKVFNTVSQVKNGQAIAMLVAIPNQTLPKVCMTDWVYLDGLQDPGNAGTIIRTAVAAGIKLVCTSPGTVSLWSPKALRSAMGAHFFLDIVEGVSLSKIFDSAQAGGARVRAMSGLADRTIFQCDLRPKTIWALGNEGQGLDLTLYSPIKADQNLVELLLIPQQSVESLNVAVAASICFYEQWRQRNSD
jgi:RNA methyltransferase, TrmH family